MTEHNLKERGEIYRQLMEFAPFQYLVKELQGKAEDIKDGITECLEPGKDSLYDKGIRAGIRLAIDIPEEAIKESEHINEENS